MTEHIVKQFNDGVGMSFSEDRKVDESSTNMIRAVPEHDGFVMSPKCLM